jgi:hypothetical protein
MSTAEVLDDPRKSRHAVEGRGPLHGARTYALLIERDAQALLDWIGEKPARDLSVDCLKQYGDHARWTPGYRRAVVERATAALHEACAETAEQVRRRLARMAESLLAETLQPQRKRDDSGLHSRLVKDEDGNPVMERSHGAAQGYLTFLRDTLLPAPAAGAQQTGVAIQIVTGVPVPGEPRTMDAQTEPHAGPAPAIDTGIP